MVGGAQWGLRADLGRIPHSFRLVYPFCLVHTGQSPLGEKEEKEKSPPGFTSSQATTSALRWELNLKCVCLGRGEGQGRVVHSKHEWLCPGFSQSPANGSPIWTPNQNKYSSELKQCYDIKADVMVPNPEKRVLLHNGSLCLPGGEAGPLASCQLEFGVFYVVKLGVCMCVCVWPNECSVGNCGVKA